MRHPFLVALDDDRAELAEVPLLLTGVRTVILMELSWLSHDGRLATFVVPVLLSLDFEEEIVQPFFVRNAEIRIRIDGAFEV